MKSKPTFVRPARKSTEPPPRAEAEEKPVPSLAEVVRRSWPDVPRQARKHFMEDEFWASPIREAGVRLDDPFMEEDVKKEPPPPKVEPKPVQSQSEALRDDWPYMSRRERESALTGQVSEYWVPIIQEAGVSPKDPHLRRPKPPKPTPEEIAARAEAHQKEEQETVDRGLTPSLIDLTRYMWRTSARGGREWMLTQPSHAMVVEALGLKMTDRYVSMAEDERRQEREEEKERQRRGVDPFAEPRASDEDVERVAVQRIRTLWPHLSAAEREEGLTDPAWGPYVRKAGVAMDAPTSESDPRPMQRSRHRYS